MLTDDELDAILNSNAVVRFLKHHEATESRPRVACSQCQFEYVKAEGCSNCGQGKVQV
jgi:hypothetical protein